MIYIDNQTVAVDNFDDLRSTLEANNQYIHVRLAKNIVMTSGIRLNAARAQMTIDGEYPQGSGETHTLREAGGDVGNIYINQASAVKLTFQNLTIEGLNHFGMPRVDDMEANANVAVTYRNVHYSGPQLIWHPRGNVTIIDSTIEIVTVAGGSSANEVGELHTVAIGGTTKITHRSSGCAVFYFYRADSAFRVLTDANVEITSTYDFLYRTGSTQFVMEPRARLNLTTLHAFARDGGHPLSSVLIDEGASFRYIRQSNIGSDVSIFIDDSFTVNRGAKVYMEVNYQNNAPLIRFTGIVASRSLTLNEPKSFVLYNRGTGVSAAVFAFSSSTPFHIKAHQVNLWPTATPLESDGGGFTDNAPGRWVKRDRSAFEITGTVINRTAPPGTVIMNTTLEDADINPESPLSMLQLNQARAFSAGYLPLTINRVVIPQRRVSGTSEPSANVRITYDYVPFGERLDCTCDETGYYVSQTEPGELPFGTTLLVTANTPFLLTTLETTAVYDEDLNIEAPDTIEFIPRPFSLDPVLMPRRTPSEEETPYRLVVTDSREIRTPWHIWAMITVPLQTAERDILHDAVVYATDDGELHTLKTDAFILVHRDDLLEDITILEWESDKGVLLRIRDSMRSGMPYSTQILWEVRPEIEEEVVEDDPE